MFAVVASSAVTARVKAPVQARSASTPKASLVTKTTSAPAPASAKLAKKAQAVMLTAATTMLPAAAAFAAFSTMPGEEAVEIVPVDLRISVGFILAIGIAAFSTLPTPASASHKDEEH